MLSLAKQRGWGHVKARALHELLNTIPTMDINNLQILDAYAEIDAYSQGKCTLHICRPCLQQETWGKTIFGLLQLPPS